MNYPDLKFSVARQPAWTDGAKPWTGDQAGMALAISAQSPNKDVTAKFVKFMFDPERYSKFINGSLGIPTTKEGADKLTDPIIKEMAGWLAAGEGCPHILYGDGSMSALSDGAAGVLDGSLTTAEAGAEIQKLVEEAAAR
jgi:ABC-type glycerol-3-phosphate transport system substrate-binding protein